jgi:hypothetical protein
MNAIALPIALAMAATCILPASAQTVTPTATAAPTATPSPSPTPSPTPGERADGLPAGPLASGLFPRDVKTTYKPHEGVKSWTCNWAVDCNAGLAPIFHTGDAQSLGRTGGWRQLELKSWKHRVNGTYVTTQIGFAFAPSTFDRTVKFLRRYAPRGPYEDFVDVQYGLGLLPAHTQPAFLPGLTQDRATYMTLVRGTAAYWAAAWYHDSIDIEAIAVCVQCSPSQRVRTHRQFLAALHVLAGR